MLDCGVLGCEGQWRCPSEGHGRECGLRASVGSKARERESAACTHSRECVYKCVCVCSPRTTLPHLDMATTRERERESPHTVQECTLTTLYAPPPHHHYCNSFHLLRCFLLFFYFLLFVVYSAISSLSRSDSLLYTRELAQRERGISNDIVYCLVIIIFLLYLRRRESCSQKFAERVQLGNDQLINFVMMGKKHFFFYNYIIYFFDEKNGGRGEALTHPTTARRRREQKKERNCNKNGGREREREIVSLSHSFERERHRQCVCV